MSPTTNRGFYVWYNKGNMTFFNIIIPAFNCESTIERCIQSIERQTFKDYSIIIVDDCSTDGTREKLKQFDNAEVILLNEKRFNGGARNVGIEHQKPCEYTLFIDSDDEFIDGNLFQELHDLIVEQNFPDMVRLPYGKVYDSTGHQSFKKRFDESSIADVAWSGRVAVWTKAVRYGMVPKFPENTLFEDVCQHLAQCDVIESVAWFPRAFVMWHIHDDSTSHANSPKWQSSVWRYVADLMDLELTKEYTRSRRDKKIRGTKRGLWEGKAIQ